ncbi:MAG: secondary thiamine-phosphate synthase enzyme YjbQ [Dehalococcoidia bacterium]|nr:secondary thiamine-phosphate synthase enzyme YjbQ [Dehalococcoidia bacterium]MDZ4277968.1 secondary thiamine-phosphate synthase enzyme YjbQ [Dehalococcoidia bacterium]
MAIERTFTEVATRREGVASSSGAETVVHCEALIRATTCAPEFIDITDEVVRIVTESGVRFGQVAVYSTHTTAAIKVNENEPLLLQDMARILHQIAPLHGEYDHNDFSRRTVNIEEDECANGHAHCQHLFLSTSETIPILDGRLPLGQWQRIFLIELDRPRERRVLVNIVGVGE